MKTFYTGFRPQQGLSIMNMTQKNSTARLLRSFRPQQGLSIMNKHKMFC